MFGTGLMEVAIGLIFIYLILSLACTVVSEWIAGLTGMRASNLEAGIRSLFSNGTIDTTKTLADAVYEHGLVQSLYRQDWLDARLHRPGRPSYIPSRTFALTLIDILVPAETGGSRDLAALRNAILKLPSSKGKEALLAVTSHVEGDITSARVAIENWYNDGMDRVAGWYKRKSQLILLVLGLGVTIVSNTDSVLVAKTLWYDPELRASTVAAAQTYINENNSNTSAGEPLGKLKSISGQLQSLQLPIGWPKEQEPGDYSRSFPREPRDIFFRLLGWLFTALALSLGAPFWFDLLNKFMVVRSTIKPREKSGVERSKDAS
jgi:hypothetical protein